MTRDDIFWLAQRLLMLWLFYLGVTHIYQPPDAGDHASAKAAIVMPFLGALVLFGVTSRSKPDEGKREVHLSMRREDLLWVACKVFGLWLLFEAVRSLVMVTSVLFGDFQGMPLIWIWPGVVIYGATGAWLFFGEIPWLHGSKTR